MCFMGLLGALPSSGGPSWSRGPSQGAAETPGFRTLRSKQERRALDASHHAESVPHHSVPSSIIADIPST